MRKSSTITKYNLAKATAEVLWRIVLDLVSANSSEDTNTHSHDVRDGQHSLMGMIASLTATPSGDWAVFIRVCGRASATESSAKEASEALGKAFKQGDAPQQLSATRLWAFMLLNSSELFVSQCAKREFLDTLENVLTSQRTSPVVCRRLLDVLAGAAYASARTSYKNVSGFSMLWKKVKPVGKPDEGIPLNPDDVMVNQASPRRRTEISPTPSYLPTYPQPDQAAVPRDNNGTSFTLRLWRAFGWKVRPFNCSICMNKMAVDSISRNDSCGHIYCYGCLRGQVTPHLDKYSFPILCPACPATQGKGKVFECCICMNEMPVYFIARIDSCGHTFCRQCLLGHVTARLEERKFPILCPTCIVDKGKGKGKVGEVSPILALDLGISDEQFDIWSEMEMAPFAVLVHCRKCQRSMFVARDEHEEVNVITCPLPNCNHRWCKKCQKSLGFLELTHSCDGTAELEHLMKEKGWKYCPTCKTPIQKISGCNHMSCITPGCNTRFCYFCSGLIVNFTSDWLATSIDYAKKCRCWY